MFCFSISQSISTLHARRLDHDSSGFIDAYELKTLLNGMADQSEIDEMIADADNTGDHDGKISKKEFVMFVQSH